MSTSGGELAAATTGAVTGKRLRVLLKISGQACCRAGETGLSIPQISMIGEQIKRVATQAQLAIVVGGGNILRGRDLSGYKEIVRPATSHYMGMLATVINALALQEVLESLGVAARVQSALRVDNVCEPYIRRRCMRHLEKGRVVILAGGTGSPFVTTDTAAALRGRELDADVLLKATKVDGVYAEDPVKNPHAARYSEISYDEMLAKNLQVMDAMAIQHCREQNLPVVVFDYTRAGNIERAVAGERIGTRIVAHVRSQET
jgi:uridylate kinase